MISRDHLESRTFFVAVAASLWMCLAAPPLVASPPSGRAEHLLESAIRERASIPDGARVVITDLKPSDPKAWGRSRDIASIELPAGAATFGVVTSIARLEGASGPAPLWLLAKVEIHEPIVVAQKAIARGAVISPNDVAVQWRAARDRSSLSRLDVAIGKRAKVSITAGEPIETRMLEAPPVVGRGEPVTVKVRGRGYQLTAAGETLATAGLGETVRVKVVPTGKIVDALVLSASTVEVAATGQLR